MSQEELIPILKANRRKWFSKTEFRPFVSITEQNLVRSVSRLCKYSACYGLKTKKGKKGKNFLRFD